MSWFSCFLPYWTEDLQVLNDKISHWTLKNYDKCPSQFPTFHRPNHKSAVLVTIMMTIVSWRPSLHWPVWSYDPSLWPNSNGKALCSGRSSGGRCFSWLWSDGYICQHQASVRWLSFCISTSPSPPSDFWPRPWDPTDKPTSRLDCGKTVSTLTEPSTALSYNRDVLQKKSFPVSSHNLLLHITMRVMNKCCWCPLYLLLLSTFSLFDWNEEESRLIIHTDLDSPSIRADQ